MRTLWVVVVIALAGACGGKQQAEAPAPAPTVVGNEAAAPADPPAEQLSGRTSRPNCTGGGSCTVRIFQYFRDEMCRCADTKEKDCAQQVTDDMTLFAQESARTSPRNEKTSEADIQQMEELGKQLGECTTKAMMADMDDPADQYRMQPSGSTTPPPGRQTPVGPPPGPKPACGKTQSCAMDTMVWFADAMCACTTKQCAQDVTDEMTKWAQEAAKNPPKATKTSEADMKKMETVGKRLGECTTDVMMNTP